MDIEKITDLQQLSGEQKEIAEVIGLESYQKLVEYYGGSSIYVKKFDTLVKPARNAEIQAKFNGSNYSQLAKEYKLSEMAIRKIIHKK